MPCYDNGQSADSSRDSSRELQDENNRLEAMLCSLCTIIESTTTLEGFLAKHDEKESGIRKETFIRWWIKHQREDAERRARERRVQERKQLKRSGLAKLSTAERKALGL